MEFTWLDDFLALAETGHFSRAAERRNLTQPAFSRRIQALEDWVGAPLFHRDARPVALTEAGERFRPAAEEALGALARGRTEAREAGGAAAATLRFAATHALSLTFLPAWLHTLEAEVPLGPVRLMADSMEACERILLAGQAHFLLCHHHDRAPSRLDPVECPFRALGTDVLIPVCAPGPGGAPRFPAVPVGSTPAPHLAYGPESGMGRILAAAALPAALEPVFTSRVATVLVTAALDGRGLAWLPLSLAREHLEARRLVRAGDTSWDVPMEIRIHRAPHVSPAAAAFWARIGGTAQPPA
ncbi:LysR family transcriptional regulator [Mesoterricola sediminis]|uniref:LysR family transcriptional regulator n=1 Tax=Mesoterricola sediminis TaxID=2927980 RepID=A0AA48GN01_9BACT|nr:LysR family transcriptional regulator [Mesoterricola sediminis]BDU76061.1 LysR family transcriptional regulator [Mesoterricola sediminis]